MWGRQKELDLRLPEQDKTLTSIVGSYPKPRSVYPQTGRVLLDSVGFDFEKRRKEIGLSAFDRLLDKATLRAIHDQNQAGIDIITDGEERRGHYVLHVVNKLGGIDAGRLKRVSIRAGTEKRRLPRVTGKLVYQSPIVLDEFRFTQTYARGIAKIGLPGPTTVADCVADEYYHDRKRLAYDYAKAIHQEVAALIDAGCRVIQFDDPVLLRYPEDAVGWGLDALERCFAGFEDKATFIVHICCGYPNKPLEKKGIAYKANKDYYREILSWLSRSKLDVISIEGAQSHLDVSVLGASGQKTVMLGVLDVGENTVEGVDDLVERGREALRYLPKNRLIMAPDCGMIELSRAAAKQKLHNLSVAARQLNDMS